MPGAAALAALAERHGGERQMLGWLLGQYDSRVPFGWLADAEHNELRRLAQLLSGGERASERRAKWPVHSSSCQPMRT